MHEKTLELEYSNMEIDVANTLLNSIIQLENHGCDNVLSTENPDFNDDNLIAYSDFRNRLFDNQYWVGINGINMSIIDCLLKGCSFTNSNLKYTNFCGSSMNITAEATSFDYSDFSNATIENSQFSGCSMSNGFFYRTKFKSCQFEHVEFTNAIFLESIIENIDFSHVSFENAEFRNCTFIQCIFPYFEILHISCGLGEILQNQELEFMTVHANHLVTCTEFKQELHELLPAFYSKADYMAIGNINISEGNIQDGYISIISGLKRAAQRKDFRKINNLCRLASCNHIFSRQHLKEFYRALEQSINIEELSNVEYNRYFYELLEAKRMLIDHYLATDNMYITLATKFCYRDTVKLTTTMDTIYKTADMVDPSMSCNIIVRHNSPPTFTIDLCGDVGNLLLLFALLSYIFKKTTVFIDTIQNIIRNHNEIKLQKMDIVLKKMEIEKNNKQSSCSILLPEDYADISYILKTTPSCPIELLSSNTLIKKDIPLL